MPRRGHDKHRKHFHLVTDYLRHGEHKRDVEFTLHHRKRYCLGGKCSTSNCVLVDKKSHIAFNALVFVASRICNVHEKFVITGHIAVALNRINEIFEYAMIVDIDAMFMKFTERDRLKDERFQDLVGFTSALKHIKKRNVEREHLEYAVAKVRIISRIISESRNRPTRPDKLVELFNSVWLPKGDPIHYGYWAHKKKKNK